MKKIITLTLIITILGLTASAQRGQNGRFDRGRITMGLNNGGFTRIEKSRLQQNAFRYRLAQRHARRDGFVSPMERRRLRKMRGRERRELFFFRHNGNRRVI